MFLEDSGSSLDGEVDFGYSTQDMYNKKYAYDRQISEADAFAQSANTPPDTPNLLSTDTFKSSVQSTITPTSEVKNVPLNDFNIESTESSNIDKLLPSVKKINIMLAERGFCPVTITSNDINIENHSVSVFKLDAWANSVAFALEDIIDNLEAQKTDLLNISLSSRAETLSRTALENEVRNLQEKNKFYEHKLGVRKQEADILGNILP